MKTMNDSGWHPHMPEDPVDRIGLKAVIWTILTLFTLAYCGAAGFGAVLQLYSFFFCLAVVFGWYTFTELHVMEDVDDPFT